MIPQTIPCMPYSFIAVTIMVDIMWFSLIQEVLNRAQKYVGSMVMRIFKVMVFGANLMTTLCRVVRKWKQLSTTTEATRKITR